MISHSELDRLDLESSQKWDAEQQEPKGFWFNVRWLIRGLFLRAARRL